MTKEEQRFNAAVAAMNGLLANNSFIFNMNNDYKLDFDNLLSCAIDCADNLIKKLDKKVDNKVIQSTYDTIVADTVVTKPNPDAIVVTKNQILNHRIR